MMLQIYTHFPKLQQYPTNFLLFLHLPDFLKTPHKTRFAKLLEKSVTEDFLFAIVDQGVTI